MTNCDAEPAQAPGRTQRHGALRVVRPGDLVVLQVSENSAALLGSAPEHLLGQPIDVVAAVVVAGDQALQLVATAQRCRVGEPAFGNHPAVAVGVKLADLDAVQAGELANLLHGDSARLPFGMGAACELLAQAVPLQHPAIEQQEHLAYRLCREAVHQQLIAQALQEGSLWAMTDGAPTVLKAIQADGVALYHHSRWWRVRPAPPDAALDALAQWPNARAEFADDTRLLTGPLDYWLVKVLHPTAQRLTP